VSVDEAEFDSRHEISHAGLEADAGPLGNLPRLSTRRVQLEQRLARLGSSSPLVGELFGPSAVVEPVEILWHASGLRRPGLVAQLSWPRLSTRVAIGIETPIAHAVVDRLLGFERNDAEGRLQLTPVEWGVWTFLTARALLRWHEVEGPLGPWDLMLDRVGPDPLDTKSLGPIITLRWPVRLDAIAGCARVWLPESLVARWLTAHSSVKRLPSSARPASLVDLSGVWRAEAGAVDLPDGLKTLRVGAVLPLDSRRLRGTPRSPQGVVELALTSSTREGRWVFAAEPTIYTGAGRLTLTAPLRHVNTPREALALEPKIDPFDNPAPGAIPTDVPVTLTVELGRVNFSVQRLTELRPGDVVELSRHAREPVELTSGGRLVARGELVQIDTELGVRVTHVFL
jgi:type III secretion system YscQ/HrcQ family protein